MSERRGRAAVGQVLPLQTGTTWANRLTVSQGLEPAPTQRSGHGQTPWAQKESVCQHRHPEQHCPASGRSLWRTSQLCRMCYHTPFASTTSTTVSWLHTLSECDEWGCIKAQPKVGKQVETQAQSRSIKELMKGPELWLFYVGHTGAHPGTREVVEKEKGRKRCCPF